MGWPKQYGARSFRIQFQNKLPTRLIEGDEILSAINFKTARLHFIGDVFVAVVVAYAPKERREAKLRLRLFLSTSNYSWEVIGGFF